MRALQLLAGVLIVLSPYGVAVAHGATGSEPGVGPVSSSSPTLATSPPATEAWWTGSLLSASPDTLPVGHWLVEPYVVDSHVEAAFDADGHRHASPPSTRISTAAYVMYGLVDGVSIGMQPRAMLRSRGTEGPSAGPSVGDVTMMLQVRLNRASAGSWQPTTSIVLSETLPTGRYDHLAPGAIGASGAGVHRTDLGFYAQSLGDVMAGHPLRARLNATVGWADRVGISGVSVYGTAEGFTGRAKPGRWVSVDTAVEFSLTRHWVLALDVVYQGQASSLVEGRVGSASDVIRTVGDASHAWAVAPALEYNFSPNVGVIAGVQAAVSGHNAPADRVGAVALNLFF